MNSLWIVHRDPGQRARLARLAGAGDDTVLGHPADPVFEHVPPARMVLLGAEGDLEAELEFAHRAARRLPEAAWILLSGERAPGQVRALFDTLDAEILRDAGDARLLRWRIASGPSRRRAGSLPLSQRASRDLLAGRFARWFADLELPELLRALDPRLADVPLLVRGEPGTGRALLVRYVHAFGGTAGGALARVPCRSSLTGEQVARTIAARARTERGRRACTIWLEDADRLPAAVQQEIQGWIEFGPPEGLVRTRRVRFAATCAEEGRAGRAALAPGLAEALAGLCLRLPPLRERRAVVASVASDCARSWCEARALPRRSLDASAIAALEAWDWPGNLRELEAVVVQSLSASAADPLRARDLVHGGLPFGPGAPAERALELEEPAPREAPERVEPAPEVPIPVAASAEPSAVPAEEPAIPVELVGTALEDEESPAAPPAPPEPAPPGPEPSDAGLRRLARALSHELRNPLTSILTFAQILARQPVEPELADLAEQVGRDVKRLTGRLERLRQLAELGPPRPGRVDVSALLEELLEARRESIRSRRLLVLKELESREPRVISDPAQLRLAFECILDLALDLVPERGDLFIASRHHPSALAGRASLRVLLRCPSPGAAAGASGAGLSPAEHSLDLAVAEAALRRAGASLALDSSDPAETVLLTDLPA